MKDTKATVMNQSVTFKIGTRGSLLAVTQSTLIKNLLEKKSPHLFELKTIKTQGDQIQDKPLWQLEGKDFFTKELDQALLSHQVDLVIHSYKDLGSERPQGIELGAITKRSYSNDILLIKKNLIPKIKHLNYLKVGTSSPRRIVNIESSLKSLLPSPKKDLRVKCHVLRGNVNTRIEKLLRGDFDAIILAMAGIERLAEFPSSKVTLNRLLNQLDFMVLPESLFPSAASQGALGIEIAQSHPRYQELKRVLSTIHHDHTALEMKQERLHFQKYGGGCHLAVGIFAKEHKGFQVLFEKGAVDKKQVHAKALNKKPSFKINKAFVGLKTNNKESNLIFDELIDHQPIKNKIDDSNIFVTSRHTFHNLNKQHESLWAAGVKTWQRLAQKGYWVRGSGDSFGFELVENLRKSKALKIMMKSSKWLVLSRKQSKQTLGELIPSYQYQLKKTRPDFVKALKQVDACYWMSFKQYLTYKEAFPEVSFDSKKHFTGLGKTFDQFKEAGVQIYPTLGIKHFKSYLY